jgi:hypothetical protein
VVAMDCALWGRPEPEYFAVRFVEIARGDQIIDRRPLKISRVQRQQGIRPEEPRIEDLRRPVEPMPAFREAISRVRLEVKG